MAKHRYLSGLQNLTPKLRPLTFEIKTTVDLRNVEFWNFNMVDNLTQIWMLWPLRTSKISIFSQIFNVTEIAMFCKISGKFYRSAMVKNCKFESNFQSDSNFYILPNFTGPQWAKILTCNQISMWLKFLYFAKFHISQVRGGKKSESYFQHNWNFCQEEIEREPVEVAIFRGALLYIQISNLSQQFQCTQLKFLRFAKNSWFSCLQWLNLKFEKQFQCMRLKFLHFAQFHTHSGEKTYGNRIRYIYEW